MEAGLGVLTARMAQLISTRFAAVVVRQHGLVTLRQAELAGVARSSVRRAVARGDLVEVQPRVFHVLGHPDGWELRALAASLTGRSKPYPLSLGAAAHVHGLLGFERAPDIEVSIPRQARCRPSGTVVHDTRREPLTVMVQQQHVTAVERTIIDLVRHGRLRSKVDDVVADAVRRRLTSVRALARAVERGRRYPFKAVLRELLVELAPDEMAVAATESPVEVRALLALRRAGLPRPEVNAVLTDRTGAFVARVDLLFRAAGLVVELDGIRWHATPTAKRHDDQRQNGLVLEGWTVLRFTLSDVDSGRLVAEVARHLATDTRH